MITWTTFILYATVIALCWIVGSILAWRKKTIILSTIFMSAGTLVLFLFIIGLWIHLERPPMRTMGETRLWYGLFLSLSGIVVYLRWRYKWILSFCTLMALVFIGVTVFKPEIQSKVLMPALQSPWFAPHVTVYMLSYALMGFAALFASYLLWHNRGGEIALEPMTRCDNTVQLGFSFLTFGLLTGALWAKTAWGSYWSWDPKETWAAITWLSYLVFIHYRYIKPSSRRVALWLLIISFILLQFCWWGINLLPSVQKMSMHTYQ